MAKGRPKKSGKKPPAKAAKRSADAEPVSEPAEEPELVDDLDDASQAEAAHSSEQTVEVDGDLLPAVDVSGSSLVPFDSLAAYKAEIRRYPILTREEEHELAVRYFEHGDQEAAYKLITSNLRLVVMVAREYMRAFHNLLDLVQEGNIGLLQAVKQFDPYRGVRLPSYAVWWIRAYIIRYVMNNFRLVKIGTTQAQRRLFFNLQKEKARLESLGFKPTPALIAENLGVKEKEVVEMEQRMGASESSVDAPAAGGEGDTAIIDLLPSGAATAEEEVAESEFNALMKAKLAEFGATLEGRDAEIFEERLVAEEPLTLQELGERYGVSRERVRQIEEALKKRLREYLVSQVRDLEEQALS